MGRGSEDYRLRRGKRHISSYPWEETMGRLILLLVVMAFSSHLEEATATGRMEGTGSSHPRAYNCC